MWGSIGFGIFGISAGYLVDVFSHGSTEKDYTCIFYIMLIAMIFDIVVSATLKKVRRRVKFLGSSRAKRKSRLSRKCFVRIQIFFIISEVRGLFGK